MTRAEEMAILKRAMQRLVEALAVDVKTTPIAIDAAIQRFEFCYELLWKMLKKK